MFLEYFSFEHAPWASHFQHSPNVWALESCSRIMTRVFQPDQPIQLSPPRQRPMFRRLSPATHMQDAGNINRNYFLEPASVQWLDLIRIMHGPHKIDSAIYISRWPSDGSFHLAAPFVEENGEWVSRGEWVITLFSLALISLMTTGCLVRIGVTLSRADVRMWDDDVGWNSFFY